MKKYFKTAFICCYFISLTIYAQVGIPGNNPNKNSVLDLNKTDGSNDKGLLLPKVALTSTDSALPMQDHVAGMKVYNTATSGVGETAVTPGEYNNDGTKWIRISSATDASNDWTLGGNTNGALKEFGTKDAQPIPFITNGTPKMNLSTTGVLTLSKDVDPSLDFSNRPNFLTTATKELGRLRILSDEVGTGDINSIVISQFSDAISFRGSGIRTIRGRGSHANPAAIQNGDIIGSHNWEAYTPDSSVKYTRLGTFQVSTFFPESYPDHPAGRVSILGGGSGTGGITIDSGITIGNTGAKNAVKNKTGIFLAGSVAMTLKTFKDQLNLNGGFDNGAISTSNSIHINTSNTTLNFPLQKSDESNMFRIYIIMAAGGGTSGRVTLTPASGDQIALLGGGTTTTTTPASTYIKVISNGFGIWYQMP